MTLLHYMLIELRNRPGRSLLSLFSVTIAVAAVVAVSSATANTRTSYRRVFEFLAGRADLEVVARGGSLFREDVGEKLRELPGVRDVVPVYRRVAKIGKANQKKANVLVIGIVPDDPESIAGFEVVEGRLPREADEIAVDGAVARALDLHVGDSPRVNAYGSMRPHQVVGLVKITSAEQVYQGGVVLAPLASWQKATRAAGQVNALHVYLNDPDQTAKVIREAEAVLPQPLQIGRPEARNALAEQTLQLTDISLYLASGLSFTTAVFIALSVFLMNVSERRRQLSILRAIGATRGQVIAIVCGEAALLGIVGTLFGLPVGVYGGDFVTRAMGAVLQVALPTTASIPQAFLLGAIIGPLVCVLGAWYPARRASQISPLEGMRPVVTLEPQRGHAKMTWAGIFGTALTCLMMGGALAKVIPSWWAVVAVVVALISLVFFLPVVLLPGVTLLAWPLRRLLSVEGEMSERLVLRHSGRSALTIGVLFMAVAAGMALSNAVFSVSNDIRSWQRITMPADFLVRVLQFDLSGQDPASMPETMREQIAALPGLRAVEGVKVTKVEAAGQDAVLAARDFSVYKELPLALVDADPSEVVRRLDEGEAVIGAVLANKAKLHPGDTFEAVAGSGQHKLRVAALANEYIAGGSTIYLDNKFAEKWFTFRGYDSFLVQAKKGEAELLAAELKKLADEHGVIVMSYAELQEKLDAMTNGATAGLWVMLSLGLLVGALGVVNTLIMNISEQTRELGMLRAIGMARFQIMKTVLGQAAFIGLLGVATGAMTGLVLARSFNFCLGYLFGHPVAFAMRPEFALSLLSMAVVIVFLAALYPAGRAARLNPIQAMRQE